MKMYRTRIGMRTLVGLVGLCALVFWAMRVSRDSRPARLYSGWLVDRDDSRRFQAAQELGSVGEEPEVVVPALVRAMLTDHAASVRKRSAISLSDVVSRRQDGPTTEVASVAFVRALGDKDQSVRTAAAHALGRIGPESGSVLPALLRASLKDNDARTRRAAMTALARNSLLASGFVPELADALADPDPGIRAGAASALGNAWPLPDPAVIALEQALGDPDAAVREAAASALPNVDIPGLQ